MKAWGRYLLIGLGATVGLALAGWFAWPRLAQLLAFGDSRDLEVDRAETPHPNARHQTPLLVLALDGVDRDLLYDMLRNGELPQLAKLLGGQRGGDFPHAYFDEEMLSVLPSTTIAAWASAFSGRPPSEHGVTGNEFFIREESKFAAPVPVTLEDISPVLAIYTDGYANDLLEARTVYERLREKEPGIRIWVAMSQFYKGADKLILAKRAVLTGAFSAFLRETLTEEEARPLYAELDEEVLDAVMDELESNETVPDVLTIYIAGTDLYAHHSTKGPDTARREYLREVLDERFGRLRQHLADRGALKDRFVIVTSDHGHTDVLHDDAHALALSDDDPPGVLRHAGFRVRPLEWKVDEGAAFDTVLAYQGAMAYVYVADRSTCRTGEPCQWAEPPRFEEDVLPVAEAFHRANETGEGAPGMKGTLDLILTRRPRPADQTDEPFQVYVGKGKLVPVGQYLRENPRPHYVALEERLRDLAEGPRGERAGDVLLIARNGNEESAENRYYFARRYRSWHGSPSRQDSEVPLIVAHPQRSTAELTPFIDRELPRPRRQWQLTDLIIALRQQK